MNPETSYRPEIRTPVTTTEWFSHDLKSYVLEATKSQPLSQQEHSHPKGRRIGKDNIVADVLFLARDLALHRPDEWIAKSRTKAWEAMKLSDKKLETQNMGIIKMKVFIDEAIMRMRKPGYFHDSLDGLKENILQSFEHILSDYGDRGHEQNVSALRQKGRRIINSKLEMLDKEPLNCIFNKNDAYSIIKLVRSQMQDFSVKLQRKNRLNTTIDAEFPDVSDDFRKKLARLVMNENYDEYNYDRGMSGFVTRELDREHLMQESETLKFYDEAIHNQHSQCDLIAGSEYARRNIRRLANSESIHVSDYEVSMIQENVIHKIDTNLLIRDQLVRGPRTIDKSEPREITLYSQPRKYSEQFPNGLVGFVNSVIGSCFSDWLMNDHTFGASVKTVATDQPNDRLNLPDSPAANPEIQFSVKHAHADWEIFYNSIYATVQQFAFEVGSKVQTIIDAGKLHHKTEHFVNGIIELTVISIEIQRRLLSQNNTSDISIFNFLVLSRQEDKEPLKELKTHMKLLAHEAMCERHPEWLSRYLNDAPVSDSSADSAFGNSTEDGDYRSLLRYAYGNEGADTDGNHPLVATIRTEAILGLLGPMYNEILTQRSLLVDRGVISSDAVVSAYLDLYRLEGGSDTND